MLSHSIVITVYNAFKDTALCLSSVEKSLDLTAVELVLVDDASQKETAELLDKFKAKYPQIKLVRHEKNQGYLHSVNDGIKECTSDIVTLLNSDTYIPADFVSRVRDCFERDNTIGVASPILSHGNPFSVPLEKWAKSVYSEEEVAALVLEKNVKACRIQPLYPDIVFPDGACFSVRRECFEKIGYFDERYSPGYFEELDFCMRTVMAGYRTVFIDNLYVYHKSHASFGKKNVSAYLRRNRELFHSLWDEQYKPLKRKFPKKEHKKRIFCVCCSLPYFWAVEAILRTAKIFPFSSWRSKIRTRWQ